MDKQEFFVSQPCLVAAWKENLPLRLNEGDSAIVRGDSADPQALRINIDTAGHTKYNFDFKCTYLDEQSVHVDLVDVEKDDKSVDENTEIIQGLVKDYVRHIHECAQTVQAVTNK